MLSLFRCLQPVTLVLLLACQPAAMSAPFAQTCLEQLPVLTVQSHDGRQLEFGRDLLRGRLLAVNFVFTRCQAICPLLGTSFATLRQLLDADHIDATLLSISLDPAHDTPERLQQWSAKLGGGPGWTLLTGEPRTVQQLLRALGMGGGDPWSHAPVTWLIDARDPQSAPHCERVDGLTPPSTVAGLLRGRQTPPTAVAGMTP